MTKIVTNRCYGGFGLSDPAILAYAKRKGFKVYLESDSISTIPWLDPPEAEERRIFFEKDLQRDDPDLIAVVQDLGDAANGRFAKLEVTEIPDDVDWTIEQYDGLEWVAEKHRTW